MTGVLDGFGTIAVLIALGWLLAHLGVLDQAGRKTLSLLAFYVASPALLLTVLQDADLARVFSLNLVVSVAAVAATAAGTGVWIVAARLRGRRDPERPGPGLGEGVVATLCSSYVNAGNLGIPIAAYVLGDAALVAPILLVQVLVLQPTALALLDIAVAGRKVSFAQVASRPLKNPLTIASAAGVVIAVTQVRLPIVLADPIELVGGMAVPAMLLAYGVSLRLGPLPGRGVPAGELWTAVGLKVLAQPVAAYLVGRAVGLDEASLFAVTVLSALPTAQNVFIIASRYDRGVLLARDAIFVSTILTVPAVAGAALLLG
ncbi:AEC family transporter [Nocardioides bruguierae]|uniref:AEC family transporter n=1 Tax=Nocardioides bruguierae TaxID=2945102 RepID=A0A9X2D6H2_9ACTN|nr:AEC family transporter [Nocardioides bruguierae]MCL8024072.1 AEC family transporter [Nocardioides bruguierae]MCM0620262.1 AEC family transporter [Nocardioides bruguierae]